jgi:glutathione peroxidase
MKIVKLLLLVTLVVGGFVFISCRNSSTTSNATPTTTAVMSIYDFSLNGLEGGTVNLADYKGKYILCVNVASKCGYTPQYKGLQELYAKYKDKLVVIGFPCNQFLGQEPGSSEEIAAFCEKNYGVTFPLTEKIDVKGKNQHPLYQWLTNKAQNGVADETVKWNFHKFLISPEGKWLQAFSSGVEPTDAEITSLIK